MPVRLTDPVSYDDVFTLADRQGLSMYDAPIWIWRCAKGLILASLDGQLARAAAVTGVRLFQA